ncbi:carbohydrate ABC transporter permease [Actinopolymorpha alba]|uniref:carbohydrate ABC transporter permease n=1 Tax=Actinopolymorpha alba TaxID=533267 RepID=UPI00037614A9|nr:sugar ABC transporter permease [Actinopolymorpha alba]
MAQALSTRPAALSRRGRPRRNGEADFATLLGSRRAGYLFLAPAILFFVVFIGYPIVSVLTASLSVRDDASAGTGPLANFQAVVTDPVFWTAGRNMLAWAILTIGIQTVVGGTLAYFIEKHAKRSKSFLRTAFLVPLVTSASVIAIVWSQMYAPGYGPLQGLLDSVGIHLSTNLLADPRTAIYAIIVVNIWEFTGFSMLLYIVGINRIPRETMEAAEIDGARGWQLARHIVIPMISPVTKSLVMLGIIGTLQTFPLVYLMTSGGPNHASEIFGTQIFRTSFLLDQNGYASALSVTTLLIAFVLTATQMKLLGTRMSVGGQ